MGLHVGEMEQATVWRDLIFSRNTAVRRKKLTAIGRFQTESCGKMCCGGRLACEGKLECDPRWAAGGSSNSLCSLEGSHAVKLWEGEVAWWKAAAFVFCLG